MVEKIPPDYRPNRGSPSLSFSVVDVRFDESVEFSRKIDAVPSLHALLTSVAFDPRARSLRLSKVVAIAGAADSTDEESSGQRANYSQLAGPIQR